MATNRRWATLAVMCAALFVVGIDSTIVNVALPSIGAEWNTDISALQWVVDAYVLVFAGLLLALGSLGDRNGRRRVLTWGLAGLALGGIVALAADGPTGLIAARAIQGLGAAAVMPATLAIITNTFTEPAERAKAISIWAATIGIAIAVGPVVGGALVTHLGWAAVFAVNVPLAAAVAVGLRWVPESADPDAGPADWPGAILSIVALGATIFAIIEAPHLGWATLGVAAVAAAAVAAFLIVEARSPHPMLELRLFTNPRFSAACGAETLTNFALLGCLFLFTQYLQYVRGYDAFEAGLHTLPVAAAIIAGSITAPAVAAAVGQRTSVVAGQLAIAGALAWATTIAADTPYWQIAVAFSILGVGMGVAMTVATDSIMGAVGPDAAGVGSAMNDTTREIGGALGVAILGAIAVVGYRNGIHRELADTVTADHLAAAKTSLISAIDDAAGSPNGAVIATAARSAYTDAMNVAFAAAAAASLAGAAIATRLPGRHTTSA
jgi:EmrB/QacA subfamily drug resistance transporter